MERRDFLRLGLAAGGAAALGIGKASLASAATTGTTTSSTTSSPVPALPPSPWSGTVSGTVAVRAPLVIPAGQSLVFDPTKPTTVTVEATNGPLASGDIGLLVMGTLDMRPDPGVSHTLRFVSPASGGSWTEAAFTGASATAPAPTVCDLSGIGTDIPRSDIGLWVRDGGRLLLAGLPRTRLANLSGAATKGTTKLTLTAAPTGWAVGDQIVVVPSEPCTVKGFELHFDPATIAAITGAVVTLAAPLTFDHPTTTLGGTTYTAEVLNLTSNVTISGASPTQRAHVHVCGPTSSNGHVLSDVVFANMGPRTTADAGVLGRYPVHFHNTGDGSRGQTLTRCVATGSGNHGFVTHGANGMTLFECVAYDVRENAFWWDAGSVSDDLLWDHCVAAKVWNVATNSNWHRLSAFYLNMTNAAVARSCVAVGVTGGVDSSGFQWGEAANASPGSWQVLSCLAHNNRSHGAFYWQNTKVHHVNTDFVSYSSASQALSQGAYQNSPTIADCYFASGGTSALIQHAHSANRVPWVMYQDDVFDAQSIGASVVDVAGSSTVPMGPTQLVDCTLVGWATGGSVVSVHQSGSKYGYPIDFVGAIVGPTGRDLVPGDVLLVTTMPGFLLRSQSQDGLRAWQVDGTGTVTTIAPFA